MQKKEVIGAETYIRCLQTAFNEIYARYKMDFQSISIIYAQDASGLMQYQELHEILDDIARLKKQLDALNEDCEYIPIEKRGNTMLLSGQEA